MTQRRLPGPPDHNAAVFVISVAAELSGLHPQTLRTYERMGLITPGRTAGGGRRYSSQDIDLLRQIADLTGSGIGIEGVRRILDLQTQIAALQGRNQELAAEVETLRAALHSASFARPPAPRSSNLPALRPSSQESSIVVWRRNR